MNSPKASAFRPFARLAAGALALVVLAAGWLLFGREEPQPHRAHGEPTSEPEHPEPQVISATPASAAERPAAEATGTPTASAAPGAPELPPSHPLTPAHERIYRENSLIGQLQDATTVEDAAGIRMLLKQYRDEYPDDSHLLQGGYELIADCIEHPGEASRAEAQRWYDENRGSTARRYVRRICLER